MFENIKNRIKQLAKDAVFIAEQKLGTGKGQEKKKMAVNYIVNRLPFSGTVKTIISLLLSSFIDDAVEIAVTYLKSLPENKEN